MEEKTDKFFSIFLIVVALLQFGFIVNFDQSNRNNSSNVALPAKMLNSINNTTTTTTTNINVFNTSLASVPSGRPISKLVSSQSLTDQATNSNFETIRVDYTFDPIYLDTSQGSWEDWEIPACGTSCAFATYIDDFYLSYAEDSAWASWYDIVTTTTTASYHRGIMYSGFLNSPTSTGTIYCKNCFYDSTLASASSAFIRFVNGASYTQFTLNTTSSIDYSTSSFSSTNLGLDRYSIPYRFYIRLDTSAAAALHSTRLNVDRFYLQPTARITYPLATATYQENGKYIYSVPVHPTASGSITIYNQTGTVFSSASNYYSSVSVSSGNTIISGLPTDVDSIISFVDNASYIIPISYIGGSNLTANSNMVFNGKLAYHETSANTLLSYTDIGINLNSNLYVTTWFHISYYLTSVTGSLYFQQNQMGSWININYGKSLPTDLNRWVSIWISGGSAGGTYSNQIFPLTASFPTVRLSATALNAYIGDVGEYLEFVTVKNNIQSLNLEFSGNVSYLTPFSILPAKNQPLKLKFLTLGYSVTYNTLIQSDNEGNFYYEYSSYSLPASTYSLLIFGQSSVYYIVKYVNANGYYPTIIFTSPSPTPHLYDVNSGYLVGYATFGTNRSYTIVIAVYIDNNYCGLYRTFDFIPKNVTQGSHVLKYNIIQAQIVFFNWANGGFNNVYFTSFSNTTLDYTIAGYNYEYLVFRDQQGSYINPETFNIFVDSQRTISGLFFISNINNQFNLTITDAWNYTIYSNPFESWKAIKDFTITLYSLKIQNFQSNPVYIDIKRDLGATFSEWVFPQEVIEYKLLPASYNLTYNYAFVNSSFVSQINGNYSNYAFTISDDLAFRITGTSLSDIYSNILQTIQDIANTNETIRSQVNLLNQNLTIQFDASNSLVNIVSGNLTILKSWINGNFSIITDKIDIINSMLNGNFTIITDLLNILNSGLQGNFTILTKALEFINTTLNGNFTIFTSLLNIINSTQIGNFSYLINSVDIINSGLFGNFSFIRSNFLGNFSIITDTLNILDSQLSGNFTIITDLLNILNSGLQGNFTSLSTLINFVQTNMSGNFTIITSLLDFINSTQTGNFTFLSDVMQLINSGIFGNFSILNSNLIGNFTVIADQFNIINSNLFGNFTNIINQLNIIDSSLSGNFTNLVYQLNLINSNLSVGLLNITSALISNTTFLSDQLNGNFSVLNSLIISNNSVIYNQTIALFNKLAELYGIYRVHFSIIDKLGLGLIWETVLITVNATRQLDQDMYIQNNSFITVKAFDYFNVPLFENNYTILSATNINITVDLYSVVLKNNGDFTSYVKIGRNGVYAFNVTVVPGREIIVRLTSGSYDIQVYYYEQQYQNASNPTLGTLANYGYKLFKTAKITVSSKLPSLIDVSGPTLSQIEPNANVVENWPTQLWNAFITGLSVSAIGSALAGVFLYIAIKEGWLGFKVSVLRKAPEDSLITPNWLEKHEDQLDREMSFEPDRYKRNHGNW